MSARRGNLQRECIVFRFRWKRTIRRRATDPSNGDEDSAGSDETDEVTTEEEPTEEEPTEEEPTEDEVVVEEVEEDWECEVVASACLPNEIECATDEDCPADWSCELGFGGTVSIGGGCACPSVHPVRTARHATAMKRKKWSRKSWKPPECVSPRAGNNTDGVAWICFLATGNRRSCYFGTC